MQPRFLPLLIAIETASYCQTAPTAPFSMIPGNVQSTMPFPHVNEGGVDINNFWQATFRLVNPNAVAANMSLSFLGR